MSDFVPNDSDSKNSWDISAPIFDHFFIIGPESYTKLDQPVNLYHYPDNNTDINFSALIFPEGCSIGTREFGSNREVKSEFGKPNQYLDNFIYYKMEGSTPFFVYACILKANPFSFPAIKTNSEYFQERLRYYRDNYVKVPEFKVAFLFCTSHPFHDLFFGLIEALINVEYQSRNTITNLRLLNPKSTIPSYFDSSTYWPNSTISVRESFLTALYNTILPVFDETLAISFNYSNVPPFTWTMPTRKDVAYSPSAVGFDLLMSWINVDQYIRLFELIMLGSFVLVIGDNFTSITKTVSFLPTIIMPFIWTSVIVSFVPEAMIDLLESPVPYINGAFRKSLKDVSIDEHTILVYIDDKKIDFPDEEIQIPGCENLKKVLTPIFAKMAAKPNFNTMKEILAKTSEHIFTYITKPMESALECRTDIPNPGTRFDNKKYLESFSGDDQMFISRLMECQNFDCLVSKLCLIKTGLELGKGDTLEGLGEWGASIENNQKSEPKTPAQLLNIFDPYS